MKVTYEWVETQARMMVEDRLPGYGGINAYSTMPFHFDRMVKTIWNNLDHIPEQMSDTYKVLIRGHVNNFIAGINCGMTIEHFSENMQKRDELYEAIF